MSSDPDHDDDRTRAVAGARRFAIDAVQARLEEIGRLVAAPQIRVADDVTDTRVDAEGP